jgi:hypothetical protein
MEISKTQLKTNQSNSCVFPQGERFPVFTKVQRDNKLSVHNSDKARYRYYVWPLTQNNIAQNVILESGHVCGFQVRITPTHSIARTREEARCKA